MIKKCPACSRTYSDDTISFCLADGALLSAPYGDTAPPTEVIPASLAPTQPVAQPPPMPTIAAPSPKPARETRADSVAPAASGVNRPLLAMAGLAILALSLVVGYRILNRQRGQEETTAIAANSNSIGGVLPAPSDSQQETTRPSATPSMASVATPREREKATLTLLSQVPDKASIATPTPVVPEAPKTQPVDYNKVFAAREVTQKARVFSMPRAVYTESARQNGISGAVVLRMVLAASGEVTNITVVTGLPYGLSEQAIAAARQIKFEPAMKDGRAVSQSVQLEYTFSLY